MLKDLCYHGAYRDDKITVSVTLENPADYGAEPSTLVFSVAVKASVSKAVAPWAEDFTFYLMDETNRLYNTRSVPYSKPAVEPIPEDDEPVRRPDRLILAGLKPEFLFQALRIAFFQRNCETISIIELQY